MADAAKIAAALKLYATQRDWDRRALELLPTADSLQEAYLKALDLRSKE